MQWSLGRRYPKILDEIGDFIEVPNLSSLVNDYLHDNAALESLEPNPTFLAPDEHKRVYVYHSASITFHDPYTPSASDNNIRCEHIRATPSWRGGSPRYDCVFASNDPNTLGLQGLLVGQLKLLFSFSYNSSQHACALVDWFSIHGDQPDEDTGL